MNIFGTICVVALLIKLIGSQCPVGSSGVHSYGGMCQYKCRCQGDTPCSQDDGGCPSGCAPGWMGPACQYVNLAFDKPTSQSSTVAAEIEQSDSSLAVDGNTDTCSKTLALEEPPWWGADLGKIRYIVGVVMVMPSGETLGNFTVLVSNSSHENTSSHLTCYQGVSSQTTQEIMCLQPLWGRYLYINKLDSGTNLQLCEAQIYGGRELAFRKPSAQSSTLEHITGAKEANDGSIEDSTCSMTHFTDEPWWLVDLEQMFSIQRVVIHSMVSTESQDLLTGFWLWIRKQNGGYGPDAYLYIHQGASLNSTIEVVLNQPFEGRYVEIMLPGPGRQIALCEVEVFGDCPDNTCKMDCSKPCWCSTSITGVTKSKGICPYGCSERSYIPTLGCEFGCDYEHWGQNCASSCGRCADGAACDVATGECETGCAEGFIVTPKCDAGCIEGLYGDECDQPCGNCLGGTSCDQSTGSCMNGCEAGYLPPLCTDECTNQSWGINCNNSCGQCKNGESCNKIIGFCADGCGDGYKEPPFCAEGCSDGYYGDTCEPCGHCYGDTCCDKQTGHCDNCQVGYKPPYCEKMCDNGRYGFNCKERCGRCKDGNQCDVISGVCPDGCREGWLGDNCTIADQEEIPDSSAATSDEVNKQRKLMGIVLGTVGGVLLICLIIFGYLNWKHRRSRSEKIPHKKDSELYDDHNGHGFDEKATKC